MLCLSDGTLYTLEGKGEFITFLWFSDRSVPSSGVPWRKDLSFWASIRTPEYLSPIEFYLAWREEGSRVFSWGFWYSSCIHLHVLSLGLSCRELRGISEDKLFSKCDDWKCHLPCHWILGVSEQPVFPRSLWGLPSSNNDHPLCDSTSCQWKHSRAFRTKAVTPQIGQHIG